MSPVMSPDSASTLRPFSMGNGYTYMAQPCKQLVLSDQPTPGESDLRVLEPNTTQHECPRFSLRHVNYIRPPESRHAYASNSCPKTRKYPVPTTPMTVAMVKATSGLTKSQR